MHGLILAGGEGSRLAADGIATPKPLALVGGEPQIVRLVRVFGSFGPRSLTVMVRAEFADPVRSALTEAGLAGWRVRPCTTPSSLHTLVEGLLEIPAGPVFCSMVDTVMPAADWRRVWSTTEASLAGGDALVLTVTGYVDDEAPLWVRRDPSGRALVVGKEPVSPPCVSGGVYGLSPSAREWAAQVVTAGSARMRSFLASTVDRGVRVVTVEVPRIIDLDRGRDLETARHWVDSWEV
jgi:choline kinase